MKRCVLVLSAALAVVFGCAVQPTATPVPTPLPTFHVGWLFYLHPSGSFSLAHPDSWTMDDEDQESAAFLVPEDAVAVLRVVPDKAETVRTEDREADLDRMVTLLTEEWSTDSAPQDFVVVGQGTWDVGRFEGYYVEFTLSATGADGTRILDRVRETWLTSGPHLMMVSYARLGEAEFRAGEIELLDSVLETLQVRS
jgi:hypothetical protein